MSKTINLTLSKSNPIVTDEMLTNKKHIRKLSIAKEVVKLPIGAFHEAVKLEKIYFEPNSKLTKIPEACFKGCVKLARINRLPEDLVSIDANAFKGCVNFKEITIPSTVSFVSETAFDLWTEEQTIFVDGESIFSNQCHATIVINNPVSDRTEDYVDNAENTYYIVTAKCGHVGRDHYIPIDFPIEANSAKEAAQKAKQKPRVKRNHPDSILKVEQTTLSKYNEQVKKNEDDPYLNVKSKYQQKAFATALNKRKVKEPRYVQKVNKKKPAQHIREGKSQRYHQALEKIINSHDETKKP